MDILEIKLTELVYGVDIVAEGKRGSRTNSWPARWHTYVCTQLLGAEAEAQVQAGRLSETLHQNKNKKDGGVAQCFLLSLVETNKTKQKSLHSVLNNREMLGWSGQW